MVVMLNNRMVSDRDQEYRRAFWVRRNRSLILLILVAAQATRLDLFLRNEAVYPREKALVEWVPTYVGFWIGNWPGQIIK